MGNQKLLAFVKKMRKLGISKSTIRTKILQQGWSAEEANSALELTQSNLDKNKIPIQSGGIVYCQKCGKQNSKNAQFCQGCGTSLVVNRTGQPFQATQTTLKKNGNLGWVIFFASAVLIPLVCWIIAIIHLGQISKGTRDGKDKSLYYIGIAISIVSAIIGCYSVMQVETELTRNKEWVDESESQYQKELRELEKEYEFWQRELDDWEQYGHYSDYQKPLSFINYDLETLLIF